MNPTLSKSVSVLDHDFDSDFDFEPMTRQQTLYTLPLPHKDIPLF